MDIQELDVDGWKKQVKKALGLSSDPPPSLSKHRNQKGGPSRATASAKSMTSNEEQPEKELSAKPEERFDNPFAPLTSWWFFCLIVLMNAIGGLIVGLLASHFLPSSLFPF